MKYTPKNNAELLNLNAPTVRLTGTSRQKADQLMKMFDEAKERINREEQYRDNRETLCSKG